MRGVAAPFVEALRPKPFRGDVIAAGVVVLTTLVWLLRVRLDDAWSDGVHLACGAAALALIAVLAALAPMERETPRPYQSVLYVATVLSALLVLLELAEVLGGDGGPGEITWVFAAVAATALVLALRRNSAVATLMGAVAAGIAAVAFVAWAFDGDSARTIRWVLLAVLVTDALVALAQRDRRRAHAVALVDAAGLAAVAIGLTLVLETLFGALLLGLDQGDGTNDVPWGWQLLMLTAGFGLIAYSSVDRERGPAYLGVVCLVVFVGLASSGGFAGWPLALLAVALLLLGVGLRPTTPAPPPPDADVPPAPAEPLRPADRG